MLIFPEHHANLDGAIAMQMEQWIYESHCWDAPDGIDKKKTCLYCGSTSTVPFHVDEGGSKFCPDNPVVSQIFEKAKEIVREELTAGRKDNE